MNIEELAKSAGIVTEWYAGAASCVWSKGVAGVSVSDLEKFAELIAKAEREECAKVCEDRGFELWDHEGVAPECANLIRARGDK